MNRMALISTVVLTLATLATLGAGADMMGNGEDNAPTVGHLSVAAAEPVAATSSATLVTSIPSPCTGGCGLTWDGTCLWVSDYTTEKAYRVNPTTGATVKSIPLPGTYPNGLAWDGSALWYAESDGQRIYKLNPANGAVLRSFSSPGPRPVGLAFDGTDLWCCDTATGFGSGFPDEIHHLTTAGNLLATFPGIGDFPTGLAFDGRFLWHSDNVARTIYKLNPADLSVVDSFPAPGQYPNDLAWDGRYLWVVDNDTDMLYKYDVGVYRPSVLICAADDTDVLEDSQQKLTGTGQFSKVEIVNARFTTPTLTELEAFDAVLVFSNHDYDDSTALGNVMANYVDGGGGVVCMMFEIAASNTRRMMQGRWNSGQYNAISRGNAYSGTAATLGTVHAPHHPIMAGVTSFKGGSLSFRSRTEDVTAGATRVADWSDGRPLVVTKNMGDARRVDLGFWSASSDVISYGWDSSTDGALLMANALTWVASPVALLFEDTFPATTISASKWPTVNGATIDNVGINEPSPDYSLRLNGADSVESKTIDLSNCGRATLTYWYQRRGGGESPDSGDDLVIEYDDGGNWVQLDRQFGNAADMDDYAFVEIDLPLTALHAAFRLRIRSAGDPPANDDWFVDDVKITCASDLDEPGSIVGAWHVQVWWDHATSPGDYDITFHSDGTCTFGSGRTGTWTQSGSSVTWKMGTVVTYTGTLGSPDFMSGTMVNDVGSSGTWEATRQ